MYSSMQFYSVFSSDSLSTKGKKSMFGFILLCDNYPITGETQEISEILWGAYFPLFCLAQ